MITGTLILLVMALAFLPKHYSFSFDKDRCTFFKAILPFLIILGHISLMCGSTLADFNWIGMFAVGIFFFISGYGLEFKRENGKVALAELPIRILNLVLPLIVPIALYCTTLYATDANVVAKIAQNVNDFGIVLPFTWFVAVLCGLYTTFYITAKWVHSVTKFAIVATVMALAFSLCITKLSGIAYLSLSNLAFPAGIIFKQREEQAKQLMSHNSVAVITAVILMVMVWCCKQLHNYFIPIEILIWTMAIVLIYSRIPFKPGKVTRFFSRISYEVYLCQGIAFAIFGQGPDGKNLTMHIIIVMATTIILATICHKICPSIKKQRE